MRLVGLIIVALIVAFLAFKQNQSLVPKGDTPSVNAKVAEIYEKQKSEKLTVEELNEIAEIIRTEVTQANTAKSQ